MNQYFIHQTETAMKTPNKSPRQNINSDSDSDRRHSHKILLTEFGAESGEMHNIKVIDNFETLSESINTPSYDQRFRSYDHYKLSAAENLFLDRSSYLNKFGL
jgi:hypothetical protein